jgi:hypothetical protein
MKNHSAENAVAQLTLPISGLCSKCGFPRLRKMYAQIVIDCQTQKETVSCGYCIVKESCHLRLELEDKTGTEKESSKMLVPLLMIEA